MPEPTPAHAPVAASPATRPEDRVPLSQKICYGLGTLHDMWGHWLYHSLSFHVFNIFLGVSPALVSTALMFNRLFDAVSDPFFGWLSDNTRSRFGRRRPFILVGGILAGLGLPLLYFVRPGWSEMNYFWFMLGSSALYIPVMSCFNLPFQSLGAELTPDYHERTSVTAVKSAMQKVAEVAMFFAAQFTTLPFLISAATGRPNILRGAQIYCAILGAIMIVTALVMFFVVRERYYASVTARRQGKVSLGETIWQTLACRPFRIQMAYKLAFAMGTSMVGTLGYYATVYYVCHGDVAAGAKWNTFMGMANMALGLLGVPAFAWISRRWGKRAALRAALLVAIGVFGATWWLYDPAHPWLQVFASGLIAFTQAAFWMIDGSIVADVIDYDELQTAKRREGAFGACNSWITKAGLALGAGASGFVLAFTGFDSTHGAAQSEHALFLIRVLLAAIPICGLVLSVILLQRFPLTQEIMAGIRTQLEARRGQV